MPKARPRLVLLAVLVLGLVAAIAPAQSSALVSNYNCVAKPAFQWCDGRANGSFDGLNSWDWNEGWSNGGGTTKICQRVWKPSTGGVLAGSTCGYFNWIGNYYGNVQCTCYEAEVWHEAGGNLNLTGRADSAY